MYVADYQNPKILAEEAIIGEAMRQWLGCEICHKEDDSFVLDFSMIAIARKITCFVEAKWRPTLPFDYGDGYRLAANKVTRGRILHNETGLRVYLAIRLSCGRFFCTDMLEHRTGSILAGRKDRPDDPRSIEPHIVYDWSKFWQIPAPLVPVTNDLEF